MGGGTDAMLPTAESPRSEYGCGAKLLFRRGDLDEDLELEGCSSLSPL